MLLWGKKEVVSKSLVMARVSLLPHRKKAIEANLVFLYNFMSQNCSQTVPLKSRLRMKGGPCSLRVWHAVGPFVAPLLP